MQRALAVSIDTSSVDGDLQVVLQIFKPKSSGDRYSPKSSTGLNKLSEVRVVAPESSIVSLNTVTQETEVLAFESAKHMMLFIGLLLNLAAHTTATQPRLSGVPAPSVTEWWSSNAEYTITQIHPALAEILDISVPTPAAGASARASDAGGARTSDAGGDKALAPRVASSAAAVLVTDKVNARRRAATCFASASRLQPRPQDAAHRCVSLLRSAAPPFLPDRREGP